MRGSRPHPARLPLAAAAAVLGVLALVAGLLGELTGLGKRRALYGELERRLAAAEPEAPAASSTPASSPRSWPC